jgi:RND family efflux transporter MFP subunit
MKKTHWRWIVIAAVLLGLLAATVGRSLLQKKKAQAALKEEQASAAVIPAIELASTDVVTAKTVLLDQVLAISGQIKASNSAFVKANVGGQLQGLSVREGDFVKAGQTIANVDTTEYQARLRQAQQQAESAKSQVQIAQRSVDNNRSLVDQGFISKTALDTSLANLDSAQANYRAAQAGADVASKALDNTVLRAPISGYIAQRLVQPGERVSVDARVVEIVDLNSLELEATLSAVDSLKVRLGQTAQLSVEGASKPLKAKVVRINPSAMGASRAVVAYLALESGTGLRQGLFAQGGLTVGTANSVALPLSAVRTDKPQPYIQVLTNNAISHRTVVLGVRGDTAGEPLVGIEGLGEGTQVLAGAVGSLRDGTAVRRK